MKQEQWTEQLREKLSGFQEAVPDGLWDDIEAALDDAPVKRRPAASWRRWSAAAAIVLLLAGGSLLLWNREETRIAETAEVAEGLQTQAKAVQTVTEPAVLEQEKAITSIQDKQQSSQGHDEQLSLQGQDEQLSSQGQELAHQDKEPLAQEETATSTPVVEQNVAIEQNVAVEQNVDKKESLPETTDFFPSVEMRRAKRQPLMAALYAGDGLSDRQTVERVQMSHGMAQKYAALDDGAITRAEPIWLANYEERENHERPFAIGMQLRYPLSERLSLTSGLVYTRLKSEFTQVMKGSKVEQEQRLHYVGVPLGLQYSLLQFGHLNIYASAGGQLDWNVKARMRVMGREADIDRDRCQWSLSGSIGLSYAITPILGLYVEPGIHHYLDNGSAVRNYFKDKPTNVTLQMGLQLNFSDAFGTRH